MTSRFFSTIENNFDRLTAIATRMLGSSFSFLIAALVVGYWVTGADFRNQTMNEIIRDSMLAVTFLNFFIVQKSVNRYSAALHLKLNELIASHEKASNEVVNVEEKTEEEIRDMAKKYDEIQKEDDNEV